MSKETASDLLTAIPKHIAPTTWSNDNMDEPTIDMIASKPNERQEGVHTVTIPMSTLIIRQTPEVHRQIVEFLKKLNVEIQMDQPGMGGGFGGGMGGGMGGSRL